MVAQIKEWFAAPVFPDDAHKTRRAELLNAGLIAAIALTLIISAGNILGGIVPPIVTGLNLALAILCFFLRHSMRRGQIEAASVGLIVLGFGFVTANVANLGTIRTPTTTVYLLLVILGGLLFDRPGVVVTTVFSSLIVLGMIFAENAGFLPRPNLSVTMTQWITYTTLFGFGGGLTLFGLEATRHVLARVDHELAERQRAEKTIRYQADLINQVSGAIISTNPQFRIVSWNRGAEEMFGWRADEVIGKPVAEVVKTDYRTISREQMIHDLLERDVWQGEVIQYHKNGTPSHILITISTMKDDTGKLIGIVSVNRDVTERKKWEEAIRNLARFPSENPNPVLRVTNAGQVIYANEASQPLQKMWGCQIGDNLPSDWQDRVAKLAASESREEVDVSCDGKVYALMLVPIREEGYVNLYGRDVTDRTHAEEALHQFNASLEKRVAERTAQLETSNQELEAFAYSVSHDLRAPLRAIDGFSRILQEDYAGQFDAEGQRLFGIVRANAQKMDELITDLLTLSRVSRNEMISARLDMTALVRTIYQELTASNIRPNDCLIVTPLPVANGDLTLIRQVWTNLLTNALKYTRPRAEPRIEVGGYQEDGQNVYYVKDNGVGFNPLYAHKLFGIFQRLHKANEFEGTGVGLAIVRRIVNRHGGKTWAEGQVDQGATFYFSLPDSEERS